MSPVRVSDAARKWGKFKASLSGLGLHQKPGGLPSSVWLQSSDTDADLFRSVTQKLGVLYNL